LQAHRIKLPKKDKTKKKIKIKAGKRTCSLGFPRPLNDFLWTCACIKMRGLGIQITYAGNERWQAGIIGKIELSLGSWESQVADRKWKPLENHGRILLGKPWNLALSCLFIIYVNFPFSFQRNRTLVLINRTHLETGSNVWISAARFSRISKYDECTSWVPDFCPSWHIRFSAAGGHLKYIS